jgi:hypothetical protein
MFGALPGSSTPGDGILGAKSPRGPATPRTGGSSSGGGGDFQSEVNSLVGKGLLNLFGSMRTTEAAIFMVATGPADKSIVIKAKEQTNAYAAAVKGNPKHNLGSPHAYAAAGIMTSLWERHDLLPADKTNLGNFSKKIGADVKGNGVHIPVCRIARAYGNNMAKVKMCFSDQAKSHDLPNIIKKYMVIDGFDVKIGDAPMGPLERQLIDKLNLRPDAPE